MNRGASFVEPTVEDWTLLQARLAWCYEGKVRPEHRRLRSERRHLSAWFVHEGDVAIRRGRRRWQAGRGEWLLAGPEGFEQEFSDDARILSVNFRLEWPSGEPLSAQTLVFAGASHPGLLVAARELARFVSRRFPGAHVDLWRQVCGADVFFDLQQLFAGWTSEYLKTLRKEGVEPMRFRGVDPRVATVLRQLDRHRWEDRLREDALASELGVSVGHLERLFVRGVGITPRAYLRRRRLEVALAALQEGARPVKEIAFGLGFATAAHFSRWIKEATGRSPRAHRQGRDA